MYGNLSRRNTLKITTLRLAIIAIMDVDNRICSRMDRPRFVRIPLLYCYYLSTVELWDKQAQPRRMTKTSSRKCFGLERAYLETVPADSFSGLLCELSDSVARSDRRPTGTGHQTCPAGCSAISWTLLMQLSWISSTACSIFWKLISCDRVNFKT